MIVSGIRLAEETPKEKQPQQKEAKNVNKAQQIIQEREIPTINDVTVENMFIDELNALEAETEAQKSKPRHD